MSIQVRLSSGGLSPYELTRALRHILESQKKNRRDAHLHNKQHQPTVAHGGLSKGGASGRTNNSKVTGGVSSTGASSQIPPTATTVNATTTPPSPQQGNLSLNVTTTDITESHTAATSVIDSHNNSTTPSSIPEHVAQSSSGSSPHMAPSSVNRNGSNNTREGSSTADATAVSNSISAVTPQDVNTVQDPGLSADGNSHPNDRRVRFANTKNATSGHHASPSANEPGGTTVGEVPVVAQNAGRTLGSGSSTRLTDRGKERSATTAATAASNADGNSNNRAERQLLSGQDWRALEPDLMIFCHKVYEYCWAEKGKPMHVSGEKGR